VDVAARGTLAALEATYYLIQPWLQLVGTLVYPVPAAVFVANYLAGPSAMGTWLTSGGWMIVIFYLLIGVGPFVLWGPVYRSQCERRISVLGRGLGGVRVALDQHRGRGPLREPRAELLDDAGHLDVPGFAADTVQRIRKGQPGGRKEHLGQFRISVLAAVYNDGPGPENAHNGGEFHNFRSCPHHHAHLAIHGFFEHKSPLGDG
jgi:hypothetical protein